MSTKTKNKIVCILMFGFLGICFLLFLILPDQEISDSERRKLASMPEISLESIQNKRFMKEFERYTQDQFPFREEFRSIRSGVITELFRMKDKDGLYKQDGYLVSMEYPLKEEKIAYAMDRFQWIKNRYLTEDNQVYLSVIPDKNKFLSKKSGHLSIDYLKMEEEVKKQSEFATYIPIESLLKLEDYYRLDNHFRQEKVIDVAKTLAEKMGRKTDEEYEKVLAKKDFYGVYYGQYARKEQPESLYYLENDTIRQFKVYDGEHQKEMSVYDKEKLKGKDPYELFLSGPLSLVTIENPMADTNKNLVIFRDSFGSSIAPLLATAYAKTTLVDLRYLSPAYLDRFVEFDGADVLFLYSSLVLNNSETLK